MCTSIQKFYLNSVYPSRPSSLYKHNILKNRITYTLKTIVVGRKCSFVDNSRSNNNQTLRGPWTCVKDNGAFTRLLKERNRWNGRLRLMTMVMIVSWLALSSLCTDNRLQIVVQLYVRQILAEWSGSWWCFQINVCLT